MRVSLPVPFALAAHLLCLGAASAQKPPAQQPAPDRTLRQLAPGVLVSAAPLLRDSLPGYRVEAVDLVLGPNQNAERVPLDGFALMELRSGSAEVTINGQMTRREPDMQWLVPRGATLAIKNLAEVTVIRATILRPR